MKPKSGWQKGQLIFVKAPPYYEKEYPYEISGAGDKMIRANLQHSPKVKKSWSHEEFELLIEMGMVRVVETVANVTVEETLDVGTFKKIEEQNDSKAAKKNIKKESIRSKALLSADLNAMLTRSATTMLFAFALL